jgi:phosphopantetheinyl transferase
MIVVDVHLVRVVPGAATDPVLVDRLGPHDWNAIASLGFAADRDRAVTARAAARFELGRRLGLDPRRVPLIVSEHDGGPEVAGTNLALSWSHSDRWVALAIARGRRVGVDIERLPEVVPIHALRRIGVGSIEEFVAREAAGKATGQGLAGSWPQGVITRSFSAPTGYVGAVATQGYDWRAELQIAEACNPPPAASMKAIGAWDNIGSAYRMRAHRTAPSWS